jgi:hypothetical protein
VTSGRYTIRKARPKVERDKAWIVRDTGTGRMVEGLGRMNEAAARAQAERLNALANEEAKS